MRAATYEAAIILADDLRFIRQILIKREVKAGDVRRISVLLRRLLIEGEITEVAAPRIGRLLFEVPEYKEDHRSNAGLWVFYATSVPPMFGLPLEALSGIFHGKVDPNQETGGGLVLPSTTGPDAGRIQLRLDGFMNDQIGRHGNTAIKRRDIIKYVSYKGFGVHARGQDEEIFKLIEDARYCLTIRMNPTGIQLNVSDLGRKPPNYEHSDIDVALMHLFSTAYYLCKSPMVQQLEEVIAQEA